MALPPKKTPPPASTPPLEANATPPPPLKKKPVAPPLPPLEAEGDPEEPETPRPDPMGDVDWQALLASMASEGGDVFYPKQGRSNLRLLPPMVPEVFVAVTAFYQGKPKTKFLVAAWGKDLSKEGPAIKGVLIPRRTVQAILGMQVEGWELFDAAKGHPIALVKSATVTNVLVAPKAIPVPAEVLEEYAGFDLRKVAEDWSAFQEKRAKEGGGSTKKAAGEEGEEEAGEDY